MSSGVSKIAAERHQRILLELVAQPGNDVCADCKTRNPRWASHNLGIFLCVHCAAVHRKMGTHISKVKSLTLDTWTKEQVEHMKNTGNIKSNAYYNPDETRHPPPANMMEAERDSELEKYIRSKYEFKRFMSRITQPAAQQAPSRPAPRVAPPVKVSPDHSAKAAALLGPSRSAANVAPIRSQTSPSSNNPPNSTTLPSQNRPPSSTASRSSTYPNPSGSQQYNQTQQPSSSQPQVHKPSDNPVWDDLVSLQAPAQNSSLPLQVLSPPPAPQISSPMNMTGSPYGSLASNPTGFGTSPMSQPQFSYGGNMTGSSMGNLGVPTMGMSLTVGSMPSLGMNGGNPFQQGLQPPQNYAGPSSAPTFSPLSNMQSNPFSPQPQPLFNPQPQTFSPQPQVGLQPFQQQQPYQPMMGGGPAPFQPQPQQFTPSPQPQMQPPFATTPSPIPGFGQQFQQPQQQWAGQPYMGGGGQWGAM
ncbi:ArfGap-domain-containing protein [Gloeophyllum trabeum ATCC 11539]|uniref:ArfGap-domain-containing protein n=1 Tax=Gloeophyllum trabeum (strain ATCC 11539 / FP-39264 / Madison 617) TaxID=670483 RepID=S7PX47_GLOTA|nr:ArfGap-domain-containing protein [Gloeophyllum trabeum ATCC 11539]EPQ51947.1 ArfGap-domain-containing protein [Gloeophyllum trabeum ATCC 11539]